jgi:hypothetical protein
MANASDAGLNAKTREGWLEQAVAMLRPVFDQAKLKLPEKIYVSVGLPKGRNAVGECWHGQASEDGNAHIFIHPKDVDPVEVLSTLAHELVHVVLGPGIGHKAPFVKAGALIGLNDGKPKSLGAGQALKAVFETMLPLLGEYPHAALDTTTLKKPQTTRLVKASCPACGYTIRTTAKWLDYAGAPFCPAEACREDDTQMQVDTAEGEGE